MAIPFLLLFSLALLFPVSESSADTHPLPDSFGSRPILTRVDEIRTWAPDDMYEHVNGEAELLKRYGALSLAYTSYEGEGGAYLSSEILDLSESINAYGLYRLYAGCDGEEYGFSGATVLSGDFTSHAIIGRYFLRINVDIDGTSEKVRLLVDEFLFEFSKTLPSPEPLPAILERLKEIARKPCEVDYHPEHMDYDLEAGPGYTWIGGDEKTYYMSLLTSQDEAETYATGLRNKDVPTVYTWKNTVIWQKEKSEQSESYHKEVLKKIVEG